MSSIIANVNAKRISIVQGDIVDFIDEVATEVKVSIYIDGMLVNIFSTSPYRLLELGLGYILAHKFNILDERYIRVQGTDIYIENVTKAFNECKLKEENVKVPKDTVFQVFREILDKARLFRRTGCFHVAAIAKLSGDIIDFVEDISRLCAFYKVIGGAYRKGVDLGKTFIVMSSRASSSIVEGIANVCIPIAVFRGAPTLNAIEVSNRFSITLIAHMREGRANIYTKPERILYA
ncbi:MAG: formate dehydrogenase accessory sulfurtransferase FdhD [Ignisphaera sp.]|uniref:Formate dehydrogenase accessory sulfurtransferase FdhD n=1 Tax=Ignisphaera aggregans TaxID=334771 RepID=A0A7C4JK24_9CREN